MMFTRSYAPKSKALKKLLEKHLTRGDGDYHSFDVDTSADGKGIHSALIEMTGRDDPPYVYIGGVLVGGEGEIKALVKSGELKKMLDK